MAPLPASPSLTHRERPLLLLLAAIQFTTVLDFLIIMPLGPQYMRVFGITPAEFGIIVSAYAAAAGISGLAAGLFLDRFGRKSALLAVYLGFIAGTALCALAPTYGLLVIARVVAGAFGGVAGALILAIVGDVVPPERRGAAMGLVMSSFSVASVCGVPIGLVLASNFDWHAPFLVLAFLSAAVLIPARRILPELRGHIGSEPGGRAVSRLIEILLHPDHRMAFVFMGMLTLTGFMIFPYISNYMVANVGLTESQLPLIYIAGGACTIFSLNWIGRWSDRVGKHRVFTIVSVLSIVPIVTMTNLPSVPLPVAIAVSTTFMILMSGRMVPAMALMTGSIEARYRGGFMSMNTSIQQFAAGFASFLSGSIMGQSADGKITHFPIVGAIALGSALACIYLAGYLKVPSSTTDAVSLEAI